MGSLNINIIEPTFTSSSKLVDTPLNSNTNTSMSKEKKIVYENDVSVTPSPNHYIAPLFLPFTFTRDDMIDEEFDIVMIPKCNNIEPIIGVEDYILFIIKLSHVLHLSGTTIHRLEYNLHLISNKLGIECSIISFPNLLMLTFGENYNPLTCTDKKLHTDSLYHHKIHMSVCDQNLDGDKILAVNTLIHNMLRNKLSFRQAACLLNSIENRKQLFPMWLQVLATAFSSSMVAGVFFGGNWNDIVLCFCIGLFLGVFCYFSDRTPSLVRLQLIMCGFFAAFISAMINYYLIPDLCPPSDVLSSVCWVLPGFSFTLAIVEIGNGAISSGGSRLLFSLFMAAQLGAGASLGFQIASMIATGVYSDGAILAISCSLELAPFTWAFFFPMVLAWAILLNSSLKQFPIMILTIFLAMVVYNYLILDLGDNITNALSAFIIGITSNLYGRITNEPTSVIQLLAVFLLGGMGVRTVGAFLSSKNDVAATYLFGMVACGFSIAVGLSISNLVVFPVWKKEFDDYSAGL